jgi:hypothetical protein
MSDDMSGNDRITVKISYEEDGWKGTAIMAGSRIVFENAAADDDIKQFNGRKLIKTLKEYGAVLHGSPSIVAENDDFEVKYHYDEGKLSLISYSKDGLLNNGPLKEPAYQVFDKETGRLVRAELYTAGMINDGEDGWPAIQHFDRENGNIIAERRYHNSRPSDSSDGEPAMQEFDRKTGALKKLAHYIDGKLSDADNGEPAIQEFDPATGKITAAICYDKGKKIKILDKDDLLAMSLGNSNILYVKSGPADNNIQGPKL